MRRFYLVLICPLLFLSCKDSEANSKPKEVTQDKVEESLEEKIKRHIEVDLKINGTEKYDIEIFKEHLNDDDSIDYIVTVNRYQQAIDRAIASGKIAKYVETGYMGNHNYFFYINGSTKELGAILTVPSSPHAQLQVSFENITSDTKKDVLIDHHIKNSMFRNYYTIYEDSPMEILKSELFLNLGEENEKGFIAEYSKGTYSSSKDITIYRADIGDYSIVEKDDIYKVNPERTKKDEIVYIWHFHPERRIYFMKP